MIFLPLLYFSSCIALCIFILFKRLSQCVCVCISLPFCISLPLFFNPSAYLHLCVFLCIFTPSQSLSTPLPFSLHSSLCPILFTSLTPDHHLRVRIRFFLRRGKELSKERRKNKKKAKIENGKKRQVGMEVTINCNELSMP